MGSAVVHLCPSFNHDRRGNVQLDPIIFLLRIVRNRSGRRITHAARSFDTNVQPYSFLAAAGDRRASTDGCRRIRRQWAFARRRIDEPPHTRREPCWRRSRSIQVRRRSVCAQSDAGTGRFVRFTDESFFIVARVETIADVANHSNHALYG